MSAVLLGQGYSLRLDPKLQAAGQPYAPLGALYAAAVLRERGYEVALDDAMIAASPKAWAAALERHRPRYAVLCEDSLNYLAKMCLSRAREAALSMIRAARGRGCTVLVAGPDAAASPAAYRAAGADAVVASDDEQALADALDAREGRRPPVRPPLLDLDVLPPPAWDLVDVAAYRRRWRRHRYFSMNAAGSRGCPYRCNWCTTPVHARRYVTHSPARVAADLARLKRDYAPDHVSFVDDIFGLKPGWLDELAGRLNADDAVIPFKCLTRADRLDEPSVRALRRAGCRTVWIGAESGSQKVLDAMDKGTTVEQIRVAARRLRAHGIEVGLFLQFGYPGEGWDEIEQTRALVAELEPDDIGISVAYPLPGTRFHARVQAQLGEKRNWTDSADLAMMYEGPFPTDFYRALHRLVHGELRARRGGWRALLAAATVPLDRRRLARLARA